MAEIGRYVIVSFLEEIAKRPPIGAVIENDAWPAIITLALEFSFGNEEELKSVLQDFANHQAPFTQIVGAQELFGPGPNPDIPVNVLEGEGPETRQLHTQLSSLLVSHGAVFLAPPEWMGEGYRPHIKRADDRPNLEPDNEVTINNLGLARVIGSTTACRLVEICELTGEAAA